MIRVRQKCGSVGVPWTSALHVTRSRGESGSLLSPNPISQSMNHRLNIQKHYCNLQIYYRSVHDEEKSFQGTIATEQIWARYERPSDGFRGAFGRLTRNRIINIPAKSEIGRLSQYSDGPQSVQKRFYVTPGRLSQLIWINSLAST